MQLVLRRTLLDTRSAVSLCHFERARCTLVTPLSCPAFVTIRLAFWEMKTENRSDKTSDTTHFLFCSICLFIHLSIRLSSYYIYGVNYVCVRMKKSWKSESKTPWPVKWMMRLNRITTRMIWDTFATAGVAGLEELHTNSKTATIPSRNFFFLNLRLLVEHHLCLFTLFTVCFVCLFICLH